MQKGKVVETMFALATRTDREEPRALKDCLMTPIKMNMLKEERLITKKITVK